MRQPASTGRAHRLRKPRVQGQNPNAREERDERQRTRNPGRDPSRLVESRHDEDDRLKPEFVRAVIERVEAGDAEGARALVEPLHPADIADLFELVDRDERRALAAALAGLLDGDVLAEMNDWVRDELLDALEPHEVAEIAGELETDDAVAIIEDMEEEDQRAVLRALDPDDRAAIEEALSYPEDIGRPPDAPRRGRRARALDDRPGDRLSARRTRSSPPISSRSSSSIRRTGRSAPACCPGSCARRGGSRSPT